MTEDESEPTSPIISRREALGLGTLGAGLLAYTSDPRPNREAGIASAQTGSEPLIDFGDAYEIDEDGNGDLLIRHDTNGVVLRYDSSLGQWVIAADVYPDADATRDLGAAATQWDNLYAGTTITDQFTIGGGPTETQASEVHIESQTPSGVSSVDFTSGIDSTFEQYVLELSSVIPANDNVFAFLRFSNDGGSTFESGSSAYSGGVDGIVAGVGTTSRQTAGENGIRLADGNGVGSATGEDGISGRITVYHPAAAGLQTAANFQIQYERHDAGEIVGLSGWGIYDTAETIDGFRIEFNTGNVESGELSLYGILGA